jgi:tetratricopeptide (TPR) repeat protein
MKTVIVGDSVKKRHMVLWIAVGAVLFVAAIAGGLALRMALTKDNKDARSGQNTATTLPSSASKAQDLSASGDFSGAHKQLDDALNKSDVSSSDKYALYYQQGTTYFNESNYTAAIENYKKAEALQPTESLSESIGDAYVASGDKNQAITYYKKAISQISSDGNPVAGDDKTALEDKIRAQGGQP